MRNTSTASLASPCKSITKAGKPCKAHTAQGSDYCTFHDPALVAQRSAGRAAGGHARHGRKLDAVLVTDLASVEPVTADQLLRALNLALLDCLVLEPSQARARTIAYVVTAAAKAIEVHELARMIEELESGNGQS